MAALRTALATRFAPATCNKTLAAVRGVVRECWRLGLVDGEAKERILDVGGVRGSRLPPGREVPGVELAALFAVCKGSSGARDAAALALLFGAGLRREEAVSLDLDAFAGDALRVVGKGSKERFVPLPAEAAIRIKAWVELRGRSPGPLLCPLLAGRVVLRRLTAQAVMMSLRRRASAAGVRHFSPHDLRRSFITGLLRADVDLASVQRLAGHASPATTARYDRRPDEELVAAVQRLPFPVVNTPGRV
jgi:integrase